MRISNPICALLALSLVAVLVQGCKPASTPSDSDEVEETILFSDTFDQPELDPGRWIFETDSSGSYTISEETLIIQSGESSDEFVAGGRVISVPDFHPGETTLIFETRLRLDRTRMGAWGFFLKEIGLTGFVSTPNSELLVLIQPSLTEDQRFTLEGIDITEWHDYRIELSNTLVSFYVDGELVATASLTLTPESRWNVLLDATTTGISQTTRVDAVWVSRTNVPAQPAAPSSIPASQRLIFQSNRSGDFEIYAINADGSGLTNLTNNPARDEHPAWSPDGFRIAFLSDRDGTVALYVMDADGTDVSFLSANIGQELPEFSWAPDSRRIAYISDGDNYSDIHLINVDGSEDRNLTDSKSGNWDVSWSPDGQWITFVSNRMDWGGWQIFAIDVNGNGLVNLSDGSGGSPRWSPNGDRIAYYHGSENNIDIYSMNPDGSDKTNLTPHPAIDSSFRWSPDGSMIAFKSNRDGDYRLYIMNADGSGVRQLTDLSYGNMGFNWSPDGSKIVFVSDYDGDDELYVINFDGTGLEQITDHPGRDILPSW